MPPLWRATGVSELPELGQSGANLDPSAVHRQSPWILYCTTVNCPGYGQPLLSATGQQVALPGLTYGNDVLAHIGWQRQTRHALYSEIHTELATQLQISESHVRYLYQQVYLPLLACHERQHAARLTQAVQRYGGLLIALDGLAPAGGEAQLWFVRELTTGLTLRSGWLSRFDQATFEAFLTPLTDLPGPILAVLSDKPTGLLPAVATVFPAARHKFCQIHYLRNLAEPWAARDSTFKGDLRQAVRQEVGALLQTECLTPPATNVLTVTGIFPDTPPTTTSDAAVGTETVTAAPPVPSAVDEVVTQLCQHTRYLLTLKGRPPFRLAGLETYQRFHTVLHLSTELLSYHYEPRLAQLQRGLRSALTPLAAQYQDLAQGATWLQGIAQILEPTPDSAATGTQVAHRLRSYLDALPRRPNLDPQLAAFRHHLETVSRSYWPGLFHCDDLEALPRTNNALKSHFRDTQRRLLRTTGQQSLTRRILQRTGAWELLPQCPSEAATLAALRHLQPAQLTQEQQRLRRHLARFRLHSRSGQHIDAQFNLLRLQWRAISATSTG